MKSLSTNRWRHLLALLLVAACGVGQENALTIDRHVTLLPANDSAALHNDTIDSLTRVVDVVLRDSVLVLTDPRQRRVAQLVNGRAGTRWRHDQLVAMLSHGAFVVFDQADGVLREYDAEGRLTRQRGLPLEILGKLTASRDAQLQSLSTRFGSILSAPVSGASRRQSSAPRQAVRTYFSALNASSTFSRSALV